MKSYKQFINEIQCKGEEQVLRELLEPEIELDEAFVTTASKGIALVQLQKSKTAVSKIRSETDCKKMMKHLGDAIVANSILGVISILNLRDLTKKGRRSGLNSR
jgi:hypothetical protein